MTQLHVAPLKEQSTNGAAQIDYDVAKLDVKNLTCFYGSHKAVCEVSIPVRRNRTTAFIGPSGCGKSTFLRSLNRMNEAFHGSRVEGDILLDGENINQIEVTALR